MNTLLLIPHDVYNVLYTCYESDPELIAKFHVTSGSGLDSCVDKTFNDFFYNGVDVYSVEKDDKFVGYFGSLNGYLNGFFIMPEFRTEEGKKEFWNTIVDHFNGSFETAIFDKNTRAASFLLKHGCTLDRSINTDSGSGKVYSYKENK